MMRSCCICVLSAAVGIVLVAPAAEAATLRFASISSGSNGVNLGFLEPRELITFSNHVNGPREELSPPELRTVRGAGWRDASGSDTFVATDWTRTGSIAQASELVAFGSVGSRTFTTLTLGSSENRLNGGFVLRFQDAGGENSSSSVVGFLSVFIFQNRIFSKIVLNIKRSSPQVGEIVATPLPASAWAMLLIGSAAGIAEWGRRRRLSRA